MASSEAGTSTTTRRAQGAGQASETAGTARSAVAAMRAQPLAVRPTPRTRLCAAPYDLDVALLPQLPARCPCPRRSARDVPAAVRARRAPACGTRSPGRCRSRRSGSAVRPRRRPASPVPLHVAQPVRPGAQRHVREVRGTPCAAPSAARGRGVERGQIGAPRRGPGRRRPARPASAGCPGTRACRAPRRPRSRTRAAAAARTSPAARRTAGALRCAPDLPRADRTERPTRLGRERYAAQTRVTEEIGIMPTGS